MHNFLTTHKPLVWAITMATMALGCTADKPIKSGNVNDIMPASQVAAKPLSRAAVTERISQVQRAIDRDSDGVLSAKEITNANIALSALDANKDGTLTPNETHSGRFPIYDVVRTNWTFNLIDDDGDITLSADEIKNASNMLGILDENGDGQLTANELALPPGPPPAFFGRPPDPVKINKFNHIMRDRPVANEGPMLPGNDERIQDGYMFFYGSYDSGRRQVQPDAYLLNSSGKTVHTWTNDFYVPEGVSAYLKEDGILVRTSARLHWKDLKNFPVGANGVLEFVDWDSKVLWSFDYCEVGKHCLHHDFTLLPNGNVIAIVYDANTPDQATAFGWRGKASKKGYVFTERLIEIQPNFETRTGEIVWEWDSRDHLVQDVEKSLPNYGNIAEQKMRIDPNYDRIDRLFIDGQLFHANSVDYNADLDQLLISSATFGEIWVIDHDTTMEEAKGPAGDLLYRWGSPRTHGGPDEDTTLFWQHDAHWTGNLGEAQIFNNGGLRAADGSYDPDQLLLGHFDGAYSDILRLDLPVNSAGVWDWSREPDISWSYNSDASKGLYAPFMSSSRLMPNGNVLMVQGHDNRVLEVTESGETVMDFQIPLPGHIYRIYKYEKDFPGLRGRF